TTTPEIYTLSLHDALPIWSIVMLILTPSSYQEIRQNSISLFDRLEKANYKIDLAGSNSSEEVADIILEYIRFFDNEKCFAADKRSEEHTSELQSPDHIVCR